MNAVIQKIMKTSDPKKVAQFADRLETMALAARAREMALRKETRPPNRFSFERN